MITAIQMDSIYAIKFDYNIEIIDLVKSIPGRIWHPEEKYWSIPVEKLGFLQRVIATSPYAGQLTIISNENLNQNASVDPTPVATIPDIDISKIPYYIGEGLKPYKHQLDSLKFAIDRKRKNIRSGFILADEMGVAKTVQVINIALYDKQYEGCEHCLIICCVNSAKYTWVDEIKLHTRGKYEGYVLGSRVKRDGTINMNGSGKDKLEDLQYGIKYGPKNTTQEKLPFFLILNIEAIRHKEGKSYPISKEIIDWIESGKIGIIALDEIHKNASPTSQQGKQILNIKKNITKRIEWIPMTGTPIVNKPTDVFLPLRLVDGHFSNSYYAWNQEFCVYGGYGGYDIIGYKNIPKLKSMLQPNMLRRLKKDILDLPPKIHVTEYVDNTDYQTKLYNNIVSDMLSEIGLIKKAPDPRSKFIRLRQVNGSPELIDTELVVDKNYISKNGKLSRLVELTDEIVENGEKVIIFSNWVEPLRTIYKVFKSRYTPKNINIGAFTGTMDQSVREEQKVKFKTDPSYKILLGTIGALGVSHNLAEARNIIFYDEPWNAASKSQAEDRAYRANSTQSVTIYTLLSKGTVDERVHNLIFKKEGQSDFIVDNELDLKKHPELVDMLLKKLGN